MSNNLSNDQIMEKLIALFNNVFEGDIDVSGIRIETRLIEDLEMNSIALLYMAMAVEEEFGVRFTNDDFGVLRTVGDVVKKISDNE